LEKETMSENLKIWNAVKQPPSSALRQIQAGRLKNKTDINPMWRYQAMTEQFGICGFGWKYEVVRLWTEPGPDNQVFVFAQVNVYIKVGDQWSDPIPGLGGHMLAVKEKEGIHANDEGYKMAVTDALGTSMKMLGVAADVYAGRWDGSKYRADDAEEVKANRQSPPKEKAGTASGPVPGSDQWILAKMQELSISEQGMLDYFNQTLHLPVEKTVKDTLEWLTKNGQLKDTHRAEIAKIINRKAAKEAKNGES
jgi:hypothetical protein